jgi:2-dehydropantoate 2-reductase
MKLLIYGAGAIGAYIGANLFRAGNEVTFVGREPFVDAVRADGLTVKLPQGGQWHLKPIHACTTLHDALPRGTFEATLLTVKAFAIPRILPELQRFQAVTGQIVCFQNGVGAEEKLAAVFGAQRVIAATLTSPVSRVAPGAIALDKLHGGVGYSPMGQNRPFADKLVHASFTDLMPAAVYADARAMKWSKMLLNIVANASSAIFGLTPAQIYADRELFTLEMMMVRECLSVMRKLGIAPIDLPGYKARAFARVSGLPSWLSQGLLAGRVASGRGGKWPSMYYDARSQSGRSEVDNLNGQIAVQGAALGISTPVNAWLTRTLNAIVAGDRSQGDAALRDDARRLVGVPRR